MSRPPARPTRAKWGWVVLGICVGALLAGVLIHGLQVRADRAELAHYGDDLLQQANQTALELNTMSDSVSHDGFAPCSPEDLAFMRRAVYDSEFVRDLGRVRDGMIVCTTGVGVLPQPVPEAAPDANARAAHDATVSPSVLV